MKDDLKEKPKKRFTAMNEERQKENEDKGGRIGVKQALAHEPKSGEANKTEKKNKGLKRRGNYFKGDDLPIL